MVVCVSVCVSDVLCVIVLCLEYSQAFGFVCVYVCVLECTHVGR